MTYLFYNFFQKCIKETTTLTTTEEQTRASGRLLRKADQFVSVCGDVATLLQDILYSTQCVPYNSWKSLKECTLYLMPLRIFHISSAI